MIYFIFFRTIGPTDLSLPFPAPHFSIFHIFLIYFPKCPSSGVVRSTSFVSSLNSSPICPLKESSSSWILLLAWQFWIQFYWYALHHLLLCCQDTWNIPHSPVVLIYHYLHWRWLPGDSHYFWYFFHIAMYSKNREIRLVTHNRIWH